MYFALDDTWEKISIDNAIRGNDYYCASCGNRLIMKCGDVVQHHFAHERNNNCDPWYSDNKGPWHRAMQALFRDEFQEVLIRSDNDPSEYHIADVCIKRNNKANIIFEFQQSQISKSDFEERNDFYIHNGRNTVNGRLANNKLYWIFSFADKKTIYEYYKSRERREMAYRSGTRQYTWLYRVKQFTDFDFQNTENPIILFYLGDDHYIRIDYAYNGGKYFGGKVVKQSTFIRWAIHQSKSKTE